MALIEGPYTLLKSSDLDRIRNTLRESPQTTNVLDKTTLHTASIERSKKWPNTIQALRAKKEAAKKEKMELEEAERKKVDAQEATFRAEQRRVQIEKANKMLHDENDRVKSFHSKMLLSDILQEREAQISYKQTIKELRTKADRELLEQQRAALARAEEEEKRKAEERKKKLMEQRTVQDSQLNELRTRILSERAEVRAEGARMRKTAEEDFEDAKKKEEARKQQAIQANVATAAANDALLKWKDDMRQREKDEERRNEEYNLQKQQQLAERRALEDKRQAEKQAHRNRMIAARERALLEYKEKNEARLKEQEEARIQAEDNKEREAAERRAKEAEAIDRSRKQQLWNKHKQREAEHQEQREFVDQWKRRNAEIKAEEERVKRDALAKAKAMQEALKKQMAKKARRREQEKVEEKEDFHATMAVLAEDAETFRQYANICVDEWATMGKSTKPMTILLNKKQEELLAATVDL